MKRLFVVCLLACVAAVGCAGGRGEAVCATKFFLEAEPTRLAPGEEFRLRGGPFSLGCHDQGQRRPEPPDRDIRISFKQGEQTWQLATVAAAGDERDYSRA